MCGVFIAAIAFATTLAAQQFLADSVDRRIADAEVSEGLSRFVGYPSGADKDKFTPNPKFWAKGVDFSCASPWNSAGGALRAGTLISKRHIVCANHFPLWKGVRISFVDNKGEVCPCYVEGTRRIDQTDIMVASLNAEVSPNIHPAKILPEDYAQHIGNGDGLPVATFNKKEQLSISQLFAIPTNRFMRIGQKPTTIPEHTHARVIREGRRAKFRELLVSGDSGNPAFLIAGNEPILLYCDVSNNAGSGPSLHLYRREIQAAMDELCPGYKLESFDFTKVRCGDGK